MGNSQTKFKNEDSFDLGKFVPFGVYSSAPSDYDIKMVKNLIIARKIAPFYKGLNDPGEISAVLLDPSPHSNRPKSLSHDNSNSSYSSSTTSRSKQSSSHSKSKSLKIPTAKKDKEINIDLMKTLYKCALECPICFLLYPRNINYSSCCDEPICTECLIQIKRSEGSDKPPLCPYCAQENFSTQYSHLENPHLDPNPESTPNSKPELHKKSPIIEIDTIRPEHLRPKPEPPRNNVINPARFLSLRPRRNRSGDGEYGDYFLAMQSMGVDLEEMMIMEAIRASIQEAEERERRENEQTNPDTHYAVEGETALTNRETVASPPPIDSNTSNPPPEDIEDVSSTNVIEDKPSASNSNASESLPIFNN